MSPMRGPTSRPDRPMANEAWREPLRDMSPLGRFRRRIGGVLARIAIKLLKP
jgi:hypothetical protein